MSPKVGKKIWVKGGWTQKKKKKNKTNRQTNKNKILNFLKDKVKKNEITKLQSFIKIYNHSFGACINMSNNHCKIFKNQQLVSLVRFITAVYIRTTCIEISLGVYCGLV